MTANVVKQPDTVRLPLRRREMVAAFVELAKPRISVMVLLTVAVAGLISLPAAIDRGAILLVHGMIGLFLVSASGCALNQYLERYVDWLMPRTATRPLPDQRLSAAQVAVFGAVTFGAGLAWLAALVNWQTTVIAAANWGLYVWVYTPMKRYTWWNTYVGAVAGALPVLVGSTAMTGGQVTVASLWLFAVLYIWQFPHFMAIAWLYRDDYRRAGIHMATTVDPTGRLAGRLATGFALALIPVVIGSLWPTNVLDVLFLGCAAALAGWYLQASRRLCRQVNEANARYLFRVSLLYLPVHLIVLAVAALV